MPNQYPRPTTMPSVRERQIPANLDGYSKESLEPQMRRKKLSAGLNRISQAELNALVAKPAAA